MILRSPPQFGQCARSSSNTRLSRPAQLHRAVVRTVRLALGGWCGLDGRLELLRHRHRAQLGVGCQHAEEADQMQPWPRALADRLSGRLQKLQPGTKGTGTKNRPPTVFSALLSLCIAKARNAMSNWPATVCRQNHQSI